MRPGKTFTRSDRGDEDDPPAAALARSGGDHAPGALARGEEDAAHIDGHDGVEFLGAHFEGEAAAIHTGVGDHGVDRAQLTLGGVEAGDDGGLVGDVHFNRRGLAARRADRRGGFLQPILASRGQRHLGATGRQHLGEALAETGGGAGDEGDTAGQVLAHRPRSRIDADIGRFRRLTQTIAAAAAAMATP